MSCSYAYIHTYIQLLHVALGSLITHTPGRATDDADYFSTIIAIKFNQFHICAHYSVKKNQLFDINLS